MLYKKLIIVFMMLSFLMTGLAQAGNIKGKVTAKKKKYLPNTIIYIDSIKGEFPPPKDHILLDQKNLVFVPHILPVLAGTTVDFRNSDEVAHNVFTPDKSADKFNLGTWPQGEHRSFTFEKRCDKVCDAVMLCNVHPEMEAFVVIMQNPYYAQVDEEGNFLILNVPEGEYTLEVWNPKKKSKPQRIIVPQKDSVQIIFELK